MFSGEEPSGLAQHHGGVQAALVVLLAALEAQDVVDALADVIASRGDETPQVQREGLSSAQKNWMSPRRGRNSCMSPVGKTSNLDEPSLKGEEGGKASKTKGKSQRWAALPPET